MDAFYAPPGNVTPAGITIDGEEFAHLVHVMRKRPGDVISIVDGAGNAYTARVRETARHVALCDVLEHTYRATEPAVHVTLAAGILKNGARFDILVEKCVELGVGMIVPLLTARTIPQHARTDRWQKLALAAMKQSGRSVLPTVRALMRFADLMTAPPAGSLLVIPHEQVASPLLSEALRAGPTPLSAVVCIGPEGGFTDEEVARAQAGGFVPVSLGPRRLRTETAAIAAVQTILMH